MYKVEETDFMFRYPGTSSDVWNVICFCIVWDNTEICMRSPFFMKNIPLVYVLSSVSLIRDTSWEEWWKPIKMYFEMLYLHFHMQSTVILLLT